MAVKWLVYGGRGYRLISPVPLDTREEAERYAADFEAKCWAQGVPVPRSRVVAKE
jgi:hypothetical protein